MTKSLRRSSSFVLALSSVVVWLGCSSTTTEAPSSAADAGSVNEEASSIETRDAERDSAKPVDDFDKACADTKTTQECASCCVLGHQAGYDVFSSALMACACAEKDGGPGPCAEACGTGTACTTNTSQECATCASALLQGSSCSTVVAKACLADDDCSALQLCKQNSDCFDKK